MFLNPSGKPPATVRWPVSTIKSDTVRLHTAVLRNKTEKIIKYVLRGTPVDAYNSDCQPPIFCAAYLGKSEVVDVLLQLGANPNARCYPEGCTPVHGACYIGCTKTLKLLLQAGGDLRLTDSQSRTPSDWTIHQADDVKRREIHDVLVSARTCAFKTSRKDLLTELEPSIGIYKMNNRTFSLMGLSSIFSCCLGLSRVWSKPSIQASEVKLNLNAFPTGYGTIFFGNGGNERCGAIIGLPFVNDFSDLKPAEENSSPSWVCGNFTAFVPMVWIEKETSVTVRELRKRTVKDAIHDILIAELDSLVKFHHPCILMLMAVCHVGNYDGISLVFEKISLGSLHFLHNQGMRLSFDFVPELITQVCEALDYVHASGYLHGFVNSHSIFLLDNKRAKLGCFEYVTPINASKEFIQSSSHPSLRSDSHLSIYRHWAAPEIITGKRAASKASDIYSICCVMWELIYGEIPWKDYSLDTLKVLLSEDPNARLPLDRRVVPQLWYNILNIGLEPEVPMRILDLTEVRNAMTLSKGRILECTGDSGDVDNCNSNPTPTCTMSTSGTSLKSFSDNEPAPVIKSIGDVDAEKTYQLKFVGVHTLV